MSALTERLVAVRDRIKPLTRQGEDNVWRPAQAAVDALAEAANKIVELEAAISAARVLIGATNDTLTKAQRQGNINAAWHKLTAALQSEGSA